jgi:CubicO group peptidase (beta-lactamase class C family)
MTKDAYEKYVREVIFKPLNMENSFYSISYDQYAPYLANGHSDRGKVLNNKYNYYPESAAAGLWTTPTDLAKLLIDLQYSLVHKKGKVIAHETSKEMIQPTPNSGNAALGLFTENHNGVEYLQHTAATKGFRGKFYMSKTGGNGVVILLNGTNIEILDQIARSVAEVYKWEGMKRFKIAEAINLTNNELQQFKGTYAFEERRITISVKNDTLILTEKGKWSSKLIALSKDFFVVDIIKPLATLKFRKDTNGNINRLSIKQGEDFIVWKKVE